MSNAVIIPKINLPAEMLEQFNALASGDDLDAGVSAGFPVMSIRGAKWRIVEGGEEHPIYLPDTTDLAPFVKVVLLRANPAVSKTYYEGQYVEGSDAKPDCHSNDGIKPAADAPSPQAKSCAECPMNVWGSKISPSGSKIKACADVRRIAILPADDLAYAPILLRVPGASLGDLAAYGKALKQRGIPYSAVVTKLSFDPDAAFPKIMFRFERVLTQEEMAQVAERMAEPIVEDVLGLTVRVDAPVAAPAADDKFGIPADAAPPAEATTSEAAAPQAKAEAPKPTRRRAARAQAQPEPEAQAQPAAQPVPEPEATPEVGGAEQKMAADIEAALAAVQL